MTETKLRAETLVGMRHWIEKINTAWEQATSKSPTRKEAKKENITPKDLSALPSLFDLGKKPAVTAEAESRQEVGLGGNISVGGGSGGSVLVGLEERIRLKKLEGGLRPGAEVQRSSVRPPPVTVQGDVPHPRGLQSPHEARDALNGTVESDTWDSMLAGSKPPEPEEDWDEPSPSTKKGWHPSPSPEKC